MRLFSTSLSLSILLATGLSSWANTNQPDGDQLKGTVEIRREANPVAGASPTPTIEPLEATQSKPQSTSGSESMNVAGANTNPEKPKAKVKPQEALKEADALFKQRKYSEALALIDTIQPPTEMSRYYAALCCQYLNQMARAKEEYKWVYYNSKNQQLKVNAQTAFAQIAHYEQTRAYQGQGNRFARVNYSYPKSPPAAPGVMSSGGG